ncbi:uncharacterized protein METZ01_LOCUS367298 [marine metagenome]|uniref:DUF2087 domain-containing protein n=1 Tax=marine metagenome TaxID=408172 RepID=A0A382SX32_9ZZZZ
MDKLINEFDKIVRWPKKPSDKEMVIAYLATKFDYENKYSEKEVNEIIDKYHVFEDIAILRRELVSRKMLSRQDDGSEYWKIKKHT